MGGAQRRREMIRQRYAHVMQVEKRAQGEEGKKPKLWEETP